MIAELINPLTYIEDNKIKTSRKQILVCINQNHDVEDSITKLIKLQKQVLYVPSPTVFWGTDFLVYEQNLKTILKSTRNIYYLNNKTKTFIDQKTDQQYRFIGGIFWNDYDGLNEELVTISLMKSKNFSKIRANTWFDNSDNKENFNKLNEILLKNNTYYRTFKQYYKEGFFHPIISYLLYTDNLNYLMKKLNMPFIGTTVVLSHNHPTSHALYFNDIQVDNKAHKLYAALGKTLNVELYAGRKSSLEATLQKLPIDYFIHTNSDKPYFYRYHNTNIFSSGTDNYTLDLHRDNADLAMQNTIQYLLDENQKFVEIVKNVLLKKISVIETTQDLLDFIKTYNYSLALINQHNWNDKLIQKNIVIQELHAKNLYVTENEISTNVLNKSQHSKRINIVLDILTNNHFSLQNIYKK